jgi:hypothetical protein
MAPTPRAESPAAARRRLTEQMLRLAKQIDREPGGPERLALLRQEATVSDQLEALRSVRR